MEAAQGGGDDILNESVVQRRVPVQEPVPERAVDQVHCHLDVGAGGDFAALDGAAKEGPGLIPARLDQAPAVLGGEKVPILLNLPGL